MKIILDSEQLQLTIQQLSQAIIKNYPDFNEIVIVGIQQGGVVLADELVKVLQQNIPSAIQYGQLDITFYRDDIRKQILAPDTMNIPFSIENKIVILVDDVLFTGRTIKAALDVLSDYGRPAAIELLVLIDRKEHRQFPIQATYVGVTIPTNKTDKVKLRTGEKGDMQVILL
ncbi:MAG: bifunctional pyr operon transcriptional regulator/uracil phosphoribosyltransferase PyrR [Chitinophagaceae bacterium]|nr:bifunctional pyr operon transcriptional regulator/uracil phosphoribosyltransferase PyrR [Chitinophagaceae bacterium]